MGDTRDGCRCSIAITAPIPLSAVQEALLRVIGACFLVKVALNVRLFQRMAARSRAGGPLFAVAPPPAVKPTVGHNASSYKVAAWINEYSATAPDCELCFDGHSLELQGGLSGSIKVGRNEVTAVELVKRLTATGFQLRTPTGRLDRVAVYPYGRAAVNDLTSCGWAVLQQRPQRVLRQMWRI